MTFDVFVDLNGDGGLDILLYTEDDPVTAIRALLFPFEDAVGEPFATHAGEPVAGSSAADLNADGRADFLMKEHLSNRSYLLLSSKREG